MFIGERNCNSIEKSSSCPKGTNRWSYGSEEIMIHDRVLPHLGHIVIIASDNVTKSSDVYCKPEFDTVTSKIDCVKTTKEVPFHRYVWAKVKNTTKVERLSCVGALLVLTTFVIIVICYLTIYTKRDLIQEVVEPGWYVSRSMWGAEKYDHAVKTKKDCLGLVVIAHTTGAGCGDFDSCASRVQRIQQDFLHMQEFGYDIPYNFLMGGDGRVYEGRGWNIVGAHTLRYNNCTVGIGFIGNYKWLRLTDKQKISIGRLFDEGIKNGNLHPQFHVLGHRDLRPTESPGPLLYEAMQQWPNYHHENIYKDIKCDQIEELFEKQSSLVKS